jgi:ATP-dependent DNA ligase
MIFIKPMLAQIGKVFSNQDWIFEPKIDGTRCIAHISNGVVKLQNRRSRLITSRYPEVTETLQHTGRRDGSLFRGYTGFCIAGD